MQTGLGSDPYFLRLKWLENCAINGAPCTQTALCLCFGGGVSGSVHLLHLLGKGNWSLRGQWVDP